MIRILFLVIFCSQFLVVSSQSITPSEYCGTSKSCQKKMLEDASLDPIVHQDHQTTIYLSLQVHNVGDDGGKYYFDIVGVYDALCRVNKDFEPTGVQFFLESEINYIGKTSWNNHPDYFDGEEMMHRNNFSNRINCYLVANPAGNCGYYTYSGDAIALSKNCISPSQHTWAHELGHYFSLPHTFFGWEGLTYDSRKTISDWQKDVFTEIEDLSKSNCNQQADNFCDTPPDYLSYRWNCNSRNVSGVTQTDIHGNYFNSDGTLFMSYSNDGCSSRFSDEQNQKMLSNIENRRRYLTRPDVKPVFIEEDSFANLLPLDSAILPHKKLIFSWDSVENAKQYIFKIARSKNMKFELQTIITSTNFISIDTLVPGRTYYWSMRAVNDFDFCGIQTKLFTLQTKSITDLGQSQSIDEISVYPNPVQIDQSIRVTFRKKLVDNISLYNLSGIKVDLGNKIIREEQFAKVQLVNIPKGIYFLHVNTSTGKTIKKLIIQ